MQKPTKGNQLEIALCVSSAACAMASSSVTPGKSESGTHRVSAPTGKMMTPKIIDVTHSFVVKLTKPMAGPTTVEPTTSMNST
ncbi:unnamed protein product [Bathycoccus prasinos]